MYGCLFLLWKKRINLNGILFKEGKSLVDKAFFNFLTADPINGIVGSLFFYFLENYACYQDFDSPWLINNNNRFIDLSSGPIKHKDESDGINFITQLEQNIPLHLVDLKKFHIPSTLSMSTTCINESEDFISVDKELLANVEIYDKIRTDWFKSVWRKTLPQIQNITDNDDVMLLTCIWLFYLWNKGNVDIKINKTIKDTFVNTMLNVWLNDANYLDKLINYELNIADEIKEKLESEAIKTHKLDCFRLFCESLLYKADNGILLAILDRLNTDLNVEGNSEEVKAYILSDPKSKPLFLRQMTWKTEDIKYTLDGESLIHNKTNTVNKSVISEAYSKAIKCEIPCALWSGHGKYNKLLRLYIGDEIIMITKDKLITPLGEEYNLVSSKEVPLLMRQWAFGYKSCLSLTLTQLESGIVKYYLLITSVKKIRMDDNVFNKTKGKGKFLKYPPSWFIFPMKATNIMPILNRNTPGLDILCANVINSAKIGCYSLLEPFLVHIRLNSKSLKEDNLIFEGILNVSEPKRKDYYIYRGKTLSEMSESKEGTAEERLWRHMSISGTNLDYHNNITLLSDILFKNLNTPPTSREYIIRLFEIASGLIVRSDQIELINNMTKDLSEGKATIRIALMGIGKSKVILPILTLKALFNGEFVKIVQPEHLVSQTENILDEIIPYFGYHSKYKVSSDVDEKKEYLTNKINNKTTLNNNVVLFDEIDNMYRPNSSDFNIPNNRIAHPIKNMPMIQYYKYIVNLCYTDDSKKIPETDFFVKFDPNFVAKIMENVKMAKKLKYNLEYGLPREDGYIAVPFSAVDTPVLGATFSDVDLAGLLSCLYRKKKGMIARDFKLLKDQIKIWNKIVDIDSIGKYTLNNLLLSDDETLASTIGDDLELQKTYLSQIVLPQKLYCFEEQYNVSFLDLMDDNYSFRRIGFSGTDLIYIPDLASNLWEEVVPDTLGKRKIKAAILGWDKVNKGIYKYDKETIWKRILQYDVLIDVGAIFRKISNPLIIVKKWAELEKPLRKKNKIIYVYIDTNHMDMEYDPGSKKPPQKYHYKKGVNFKYFFDQKHIIGIDLKIKIDAKALTLVRGDDKITNVSQGIFRLREIGQNKQSTEFAIKTKKEIPKNRSELYKLFLENEKNSKLSLLGKHYLQNTRLEYRIAKGYHKEKCNKIK